ncbi:glycosyltransferase family 2 protein [Salegentibacter mishustinae]|uniref:Family 2 glycosyl transferase n=1 Tax=Salegentibacter mishustinae TaxID=270918 RepID=A0A0Q9ZN65_9FLAO|nr:glycosyltransferase family 2 protein [Salegentibacter mishustinae]KRG30644.1 family 2 glycosyl transferase [Salegentibacter mishustinae]PNW23533.1 family 2 glycosyl transferase [Salegentibacter mishustinae]PZX66610.1 glycosyltransferase [Salegentibacter mishustinae]GGW83477.1 glycosyl transferase [Salegentibacter mishustinae]
MKISIITATFNSEFNILTAISSLKHQEYSDVEWIIIDGASMDNTVETIKTQYSGNLKIISEKDNGIYDALNKGVKLSSGDIIGFLHSDDLFVSKDIISKIETIFQKENVDGVYGDLQYVHKNDTSKVIRYWKSQNFKSSLLNKGWMPAHPTLFLRKKVYKKHGLFNLDYKIAADYDMMLRIFSDKSLKFHYLPQVITKMRVGGASNSSLKNIKLKSIEDFRTLKANGIKKPLKVLAYKNFSKLTQFVKK